MYGTLVASTKTYNFPEYRMAVNQMPFELEPATQLCDCDFWTVADDRKKGVENLNRSIVLLILAQFFNERTLNML